MNCKFTNVLMFAAGAAIGSAVTWKVIKTRYERIAQEEIDSTQRAYADLFDNLNEPNEGDTESAECEGQINWEDLEDLDEDDTDEDDEDPDGGNEYAKVVDDYTNEKGGSEIVAKLPYTISPYEYGELDDYHQIELTYYEGDDILEDDEYNIVTDREELVGPSALYTFGEYEDDAVFVRNERLRTDFQILKDYRSYAEARSIGPNQVGDR